MSRLTEGPGVGIWNDLIVVAVRHQGRGVDSPQIPDDGQRRRRHRYPSRCSPGIGRAPVFAPIVRDDAKAAGEEEEQLCVPVVGAEWPAVVKDDPLCALRAPIPEVDADPVLRRNRVRRKFSRVMGESCLGGVGLRPLPWHSQRSTAAALLTRQFRSLASRSDGTLPT